jgi:tetratricopeptide (TPR) repeat protein
MSLSSNARTRSRLLRRRFFRRLGWTLLVILVLVLLFEAAATYVFRKRPVRYLVRDFVRGEAVWRENDKFMYRFSGKRAAETPPPLVAAADRDTNKVFRIAILGDSAPGGWPSPAYSLARILPALLPETASGRTLEVLNLCLQQGNSHVLREVARDLSRLQPDATVILAGNHEIAGPGGPAAGFGRLHASPGSVRLEILLTRWHLVRALRLLSDRLHPRRADREAWQNREPISPARRMAPDDRRVVLAHRAFRRNLEAIVDAASAASGRVLLCTVPVNLADAPPFATTFSPDETLAQQVRETLRRAEKEESSGHAEAAEGLYAAALSLYPSHAQACWRAARLAAKGGKTEEARALYVRARDLDAIPLRADSGMNDAIREIASSRGDVALVDLEKTFFDATDAAAPGREFFLDHVHYTFEGATLAARAIIAALGDGSARRTTVQVKNALLYEIWGHEETLSALLDAMNLPPLRRLANHEEMVAWWQAERDALQARTATLTPVIVSRLYSRRRAATATAPDPYLSSHAARYFISCDRAEAAQEAARETLVCWPHRMEARALLSLAGALAGESPESGIARLTEGEQPDGYADIIAALAIGRVLVDKDFYDDAEDYFLYARGRDPYNSLAWAAYANVLRLEGRIQEAEETFQAACRLFPDNPILWEERAVLNCYTGEWEDAQKYFERSLHLAPTRADALYKWAETLFRIHQYDRARPVLARFRLAEPHDTRGRTLAAALEAVDPQPGPQDKTMQVHP